MLIDFAFIISRASATRVSRKRRENKLRPWRGNMATESLEVRTLLSPLVASVLAGTAATAVTGTVYEDLDSNGIKSDGENGVGGWVVYLDLDNSGTHNNDAAGTEEPSSTTNGDGDYSIDHLMPGNYRVAEVVQPGWSSTATVSRDVVVEADQETQKVDFFNFAGGDIVGTVWNDLDDDGVLGTDPVTDPGLANWTVYLDLNDSMGPDPGEPTTLTDANGTYAFRNLPAGDYEVTEVLPDGWDVAKHGGDVRHTAAVVALQTFVQDFGNVTLLNGSIHGTIWNDLNANGVRDTDFLTGAFTEPGLTDWTVFLDSNADGEQQAGEPGVLTDSDGEYSFISLPEGDYEVTEILRAGWHLAPGFDGVQTVAVFAGEASVAPDFATFTVLNGSIRGTVWNDLNRDGIRNTNLSGAFTDPGLENWQVFLDLDRNKRQDTGEPVAFTDVNGAYSFADLQVGDYEVQEILPTGWEVTTTYSDNQTVTVFSGAESIAPDFANFNLSTALPGTVSGIVWNDINGNGVRDVNSGTGAFTDPGLGNRVIFVDQNLNGVFESTEPNATSAADGSYTISGVAPGTVVIIEVGQTGWRATAPFSGSHTIALRNGENAGGLDFGNYALQESVIRGTVFADSTGSGVSGVRDPGERGLGGFTVYLDTNTNGMLDPGEPQTATSSDLFFTPAVDEAGTYSFTHLALGTYTVRVILPVTLSATPAAQLAHTVTLAAAEDRAGVDTAAVFRPNEIHGLKFDDTNGNHLRDDGEPAVGGVTIYIDRDRDNIRDADEPTTVTAADGSYSFGDLSAGAYVVRELLEPGHQATYPKTTGGILWPAGVNHPAVGNVTPTIITASLSPGEVHHEKVSITLPATGALTNLVDVFLLFDDTGSFVNNSPIVRAAFPTIIAQLQAALPGIDLGFGVGRFEEYANFAYEYSTGRPFVLNQPIVAASTTGYMTAIQAALDRTTPGYGGDQPETDIEALYQLVTGLGFDGNNNGSVLDSGAAGLTSTQLNPGNSGDVPSFASFLTDPAGSVMPAAGNVGGGGFRAGALPIILTATDTGFAFQPKGETTITGVGGVTLPVSALTQTSRPTTPFNSGAGIQQTVTALDALGALVIGLGTNAQATIDPRQGLEALSKLTGAINHTATTIDNGTADPIAQGDPLYFQISSGFASSVANGVVSAIQNAVTNVAVDITVQASDPRVKIVRTPGIVNGVGSGQTATFDIEFVGDGVPYRFDLQFVRAGTNVVLGSIPVVLGTPIPGDGYDFEDLPEGEIHSSVDFGSHLIGISTPTITVTSGTVIYDGAAHAATATATDADGAAVGGTFDFTYNGSTTLPVDAGVYDVVATFTSTDPNFLNAIGTATLTISPATPAIAVTAGTVIHDGLAHGATAVATGVAGAVVSGAFTFTYNGLPTVPTDAGVYDVVATFTSSDPNYADAIGTAILTIAAAPAVTVSPMSGLVTTEAGGTATFSVVLNSQPTADVTIPISSSDLTEGTVSVSSLTFTTANWSTAQTVTVTGVDDDADDGDVAWTIITGAAAGGDYAGIDGPDVAVTNTDDDESNSAPVDILLSGTSVAENLPSGTTVGALTTIDHDLGDSHTYSLVDGTGSADNARFSIVGNELQTKASFDFESGATWSIRVRTTDLGGRSFDKVFTITISNVDEFASVSSTVIDNGTEQRSMVRSVTVTFDRAVEVLLGAFTVSRRGPSGGNVDLNPPVITSNESGHTVVTLTFEDKHQEGDLVDPGGSLSDGNYQLSINASLIRSGGEQLDGNFDGSAGGDYQFGDAEIEAFFRLFGDGNGDRNVDGADSILFQKTFRKKSVKPGFNSAFDYNGDGVVDGTDYFQMRSQIIAEKKMDFI